jgi:AcrR family transcriptional regulator
VTQRLLRGTEALLAQGHGFTELSIEQIAAEAGMSRSAFYFYFHDKRQLLINLAEDVGDQFYSLGNRWWSGEVTSDGVDPRKALRDGLRDTIKVWREHGAILAALIEASAYDQEIEELWQSMMARYIEAHGEYYEKEQASGRSPAFPADAIAYCWTWASERILYQHVCKQPYVDDDKLIEGLARMIWGAVYGDWDADGSGEAATKAARDEQSTAG